MQSLLSLGGRPVLIAIIPALWMLIQLLPIKALEHPFWTSAESAVGHPLAGAISIDIGTGVVALGQYLSIVAIGFWSAAVAIDRQRAETALLGLTIGATLCAITVPAGKIFGAMNSPSTEFIRMQGLDCAAIGAMVALAAGLRAFERYETHHANPRRSLFSLLQSSMASAVALSICAGILIFTAPSATMVAAAYGATIFAGFVAIRRLGFGRWAIAAAALPIGLSFLIFVFGNPSLEKMSISVAFAPQSQALPVTIAQRILNDTPLAGTGAGTYTALIPVYHDADDDAVYATGPTAAATIAVELGKPMLWLIVMALVVTMAQLLRAALERGRDSFYALAGACTIVTIGVLGFTNAGVLGTSTAALAASTIGLALAQSKSRIVRQ